MSKQSLWRQNLSEPHGSRIDFVISNESIYQTYSTGIVIGNIDLTEEQRLDLCEQIELGKIVYQYSTQNYITDLRTGFEVENAHARVYYVKGSVPSQQTLVEVNHIENTALIQSVDKFLNEVQNELSIVGKIHLPTGDNL